MSSCRHRTILTDDNGLLWDLGNPNVIAVIPDAATPPRAELLTAAGGVYSNASNPAFDVSFADASAAFNAS